MAGGDAVRKPAFNLWGKLMLGQDGGDSCKRHEDRREVALGAVVHRRDGSRVSAELSDLSYGGCRIQGGEPLEPAEQIRLIVPSLGEIEAQVRWSRNDGAGAQFGAAGLWDMTVANSPRNALASARHFSFGSRRTFGRKGQSA